MAGNTQPTPRRSPPNSTQAEGLASRKAATADWGETPKKGGIRGEVKLALMLIITLAGAFGYIVHRKFDDFRANLVAAEGSPTAQFTPLQAEHDPREEVVLPSPGLAEPPSAESGDQWTRHDLSQQTAAVEPTPLLSLSPSPRNAAPPAATLDEPSFSSQAATASHPVDDTPPFPEQSEPKSVAADSPPWVDGKDESPLDLFGDAPAVVEASEPTFAPEPVQNPTAANAAEDLFRPAEFAEETATAEGTDATPLNQTDLFSPTATATEVADQETAAPEGIPFSSPSSGDPFSGTPSIADSAPSQTEPAISDEPVFLPPRDTSTALETVEALPFATESSPAPTPVFESEPLSPPALIAPRTVTPNQDPFAPDVADSDPVTKEVGSPLPVLEPTLTVPGTPIGRDPFGEPSAGPTLVKQPPAPFQSEPEPLPHRLEQEIATTPVPSAFPSAEPSVASAPAPARSGLWDDRDPTPTSEPSPTPLERSVSNETPGLFPSNPAPSTQIASDNLYTIRPGDNYWTISKSHYGSVRYFAALTEYNRDRIPDPQKMRPGLQVAIPDPSALESQYPQLFSGPSPSAPTPIRPVEKPGQFYVVGDQPMYRVGPGDTLSSIAQKHLGRASRWEQIYGMNRERLPTPDRLKPGTELRLPRDASQVSLTQ
ncbi:MAG: LysM peptidoglycan-binding domain-containing protein [Planctomycetaceae bacterium]|nr:LysM peptidoglycan-binding domain-containing protein [Planctomycetaceae bacterium]